MITPDQWAAFGSLLNSLPRIDRIGVWQLQEATRGGWRCKLYSGNSDRSRMVHAYSTEQDSFSPTGSGDTPEAALRAALAGWVMTGDLPAVASLRDAYARLESAVTELLGAMRNV